MGKTSFKMNEINAKLQEKLSKLENGELELSELESLVQDARELYERLLIVKYKAYENYGEPASEAKEVNAEEPIKKSVVTETKEEENEEAIDFSAIIDEPEEQPSFDFSGISETVEEVEEKVEAQIETKEEKKETEMIPSEDIKSFSEEVETKPDSFPKSSGTKDQPADLTSLNDQMQGGDDDLSLRKKLQSTPVSDLKSEISIAKKFEYITFMFEGKNEKYEEAIADLNNCADGEEAKNKLNEYSTQYNWDLENKSIIKFVELVERRYL